MSAGCSVRCQVIAGYSNSDILQAVSDRGEESIKIEREQITNKLYQKLKWQNILREVIEGIQKVKKIGKANLCDKLIVRREIKVNKKGKNSKEEKANRKDKEGNFKCCF